MRIDMKSIIVYIYSEITKILQDFAKHLEKCNKVNFPRKKNLKANI